MSLAIRWFALVIATVLATFGSLNPAAHAAGPEAIKAANYIVSTFQPGGADPYGEAGVASDSLIALASTNDPEYADEIAGIRGYLESKAATYTAADKAGPTGAAKLALVAAILGADAHNFGGVDLIAKITADIKPDGSFGAWPGPFASGLAMVALGRNSEKVPAAMVTYLKKYQQPRSGDTGGGFACEPYPYDPGGDCKKANPDDTALAVLGLRAAGGSQADKSAADALAWLSKTRQKNGSWLNFSPVNSTGMVGSLFAAGSTESRDAVKYVIGEQLASGALTTGTSKDPNLLATQQGILVLAGGTYLSVSYRHAPPAGTTTASPSSPAAADPAPQQGTNPAVPIAIGAVVLIAIGATVLVVVRRRRSS